MESFEPTIAPGRLRFCVYPGRETPLVFIHGLGCASSRDYPAIARHPALAGRGAVLVDLLGSGASDRPPAFSYSVEDHARCVEELTRHLSLDRFDLYGHSAGGAVAVRAAVLSGGRLRRLALSEPNLDPGGGVISAGIARQDEERFLSRGFEDLVAAAHREGNSAWAGSLRMSWPRALHRWSSSLVEGSSPTWREQLIGLHVPRAVLFGERSLPDPDTERLASRGVTVRVVPDAGHSMMWENPVGVANALAEFLDG